jgi:hypothetical protein
MTLPEITSQISPEQHLWIAVAQGSLQHLYSSILARANLKHFPDLMRQIVLAPSPSVATLMSDPRKPRSKGLFEILIYIE